MCVDRPRLQKRSTCSRMLGYLWSLASLWRWSWRYSAWCGRTAGRKRRGRQRRERTCCCKAHVSILFFSRTTCCFRSAMRMNAARARGRDDVLDLSSSVDGAARCYLLCARAPPPLTRCCAVVRWLVAVRACTRCARCWWRAACTGPNLAPRLQWWRADRPYYDYASPRRVGAAQRSGVSSSVGGG